jgi:hypothetical protein
VRDLITKTLHIFEPATLDCHVKDKEQFVIFYGSLRVVMDISGDLSQSFNNRKVLGRTTTHGFLQINQAM